jgi:hypothetical protein
MNEEIKFEYNKDINSSGTWFLGRFVYCRLQLKRSLITLDRALILVRRFVDFIFFSLAALGWISLFWYLYEQRDTLINSPLKLTTPEYYQHPLILVFLLTLIFDLFLYYRQGVAKAEKIKINYSKLKIDEGTGQFKKKTCWNI